MKITFGKLRNLINEALAESDLPPDYRVIPFGDAMNEFPEAMRAWIDDWDGTPDDKVVFSDGSLWCDRISDHSTWRWNPQANHGKGAWVFDG